MEVNIAIQASLLVVLPFVMQGLKKIVWVENNKAWVCPLLCITVATVAAYFLHLPQWLFVGILTGAACNKAYDWAKDVKAEMMVLFLAALSVLALVGCSGPLSVQKRQCLASQKTFTAIVEELTLARQLGMFTPKQEQEITIVIHEGQNCLNKWNASFKDPNVVATNWPLCVNSAMLKLIAYRAQAKGGDK